MATFFALVLVKSPVFATPPPGYYLVWSDEFDGNSLDLSKWYYFNQISQNAVDTIDAITVTNGYMTIHTYTTNGTHYTGIIGSDGHFRSFYGYYESSLQCINSNATWSAFWIQSPTVGEIIGDPLVSGAEMDITEHRYVDVSNTNVIADSTQETLHWDGYANYEQTVNPGQVGSGLATGFHTYGFLWTPQQYTYSIDSTNYLQTSQGLSGRSEVIMFSSQVQTPSWSGILPPGGYGNFNTSPVQMVVDYARYYAPSNMVFWTGASSADWYDSGNWLSNMTAIYTNDVVMDYLSVGNFNVNLSQPTTVHTLYIQETPSVNIYGSPLTLTGGIDLVSAFSSSTVSAPIIVANDQTWRTGPGLQLTVSSTINGSGVLTLSGYGTTALTGTNYCTTPMTIAGSATLANYGLVTNGITIAGGTITGPGLFAGPVYISVGTIQAYVGTPIVISNTLGMQSPGGVTVWLDNANQNSGIIRGMSSVTYGGTLAVANINTSLAAGSAFKMFDASNYVGNFNAIYPASPGYQLTWDTSTLNIDGTLRVKSIVAAVTTNIYESHSGTTTGGTNNAAFTYSGFSSSVSSIKSTAPGLTSSSSRLASTFTSTTAFSITPTLVVGPTYNVAVTWGKSGTVNQMEITNMIVAPTVTGVSASTLPTTTAVYSAGVGNVTNNVWLSVGTITPNTVNPTLTFTYVSGFTVPARWYVDAVKFTSVLPTPGTISSLVQTSSNMVLNWSGTFTLQTSTNAAGPYVDMPGPILVGPYTNAMTNAQQFFRLRQ